MSTNEAEPLTDAELDLLATLDAKRTPGPLRPGVVQRDRIFVPYAGALEGPNGERVLLRMNEHFPEHVDDARAIAAALNALPALLAEVRRWRGRERASEAWAEPDGDDGADVASDDGPRQHIPRDLLTRPEGR